jgi:hypothetical protein
VRWAASDFSTGVIPRDAAISVGMLGVPVHIRWCTASRRHNRRCERLILGPQSIAQPFDQPVSFAQLDYLLTRALGLPLQAANPSRRCHRRDGGWNARDVRATGRASRHPARERGTVMRSSMCWPLVRCGKARPPTVRTQLDSAPEYPIVLVHSSASSVFYLRSPAV